MGLKCNLNRPFKSSYKRDWVRPGIHPDMTELADIWETSFFRAPERVYSKIYRLWDYYMQKKKKDEYTILFLQHVYIIYCIFLELRQIIFLKEIHREYKKTTLYRSHCTQFHCSFKTTKNSLKPQNKSNKSTKAT